MNIRDDWASLLTFMRVRTWFVVTAFQEITSLIFWTSITYLHPSVALVTLYQTNRARHINEY